MWEMSAMWEMCAMGEMCAMWTMWKCEECGQCESVTNVDNVKVWRMWTMWAVWECEQCENVKSVRMWTCQQRDSFSTVRVWATFCVAKKDSAVKTSDGNVPVVINYTHKINRNNFIISEDSYWRILWKCCSINTVFLLYKICVLSSIKMLSLQ